MGKAGKQRQKCCYGVGLESTLYVSRHQTCVGKVGAVVIHLIAGLDEELKYCLDGQCSPHVECLIVRCRLSAQKIVLLLLFSFFLMQKENNALLLCCCCRLASLVLQMCCSCIVWCVPVLHNANK